MTIQMTRHPGSSRIEPPPTTPDIQVRGAPLPVQPITHQDYIDAAKWAEQFVIAHGLTVENVRITSTIDEMPDKIDQLKMAYQLDINTALFLTIWHEEDEYLAICKKIVNWADVLKESRYAQHYLLNGVVYWLQYVNPIRARRLYR